ncbi:hypothetical protein, partial [Elizabethkingia anophelis]|uniref:hypothetical protein n=1 Tax=Elizabethkingia anophelis TaxID=1117645 RepID=UPI0038923FA9
RKPQRLQLLKRFSFGSDPTGRTELCSQVSLKANEYCFSSLVLQVLARTSLWAFRCKCERFSETLKTINKTELIPHATFA